MSLVDSLLQERALIYRSPPGSAAWHVVGVVSIGALLRQLDASIVSLLFPTLETTFHRPVSSVSWVAVSYLLTLATPVAVCGRLADLYGRKMLDTFGFLRVSFSAGIAAGLLSYTVLFGAFFLVPFFLERVRHYDPAVIFTTSTWPTARVNSIGCTSGDVVAE